MPRLLIAGCGYLGQAIADLFVGEGWEAEGWTQSSESAQKISGKSYSVRAVDISDDNQVSAQKGNFDAVIHCASTRGGDVDLYRRVYLRGARNLLQRFNGSRILFVSSTSVYAQTNGEWVSEESAARPKPETGKILCEAEDLILGKRGVVVRLAGIYGPGRSALLKKFLSGEAMIDPEKDRFANAIHRDDAATAIQFLSMRPESTGEIYNLVDNEPMLQSECYRWLAAKLKRPLPPIGRPVLSGVEGSTSTRKRGESNKRVTNAKLRALGWAPRYPNFAAGMEQSVLPNWAQESA
jgi:nucleoside-diphosphate-sugar epimerase